MLHPYRRVPVGLLPAGIVLCGGTASLPGIRELGRDILGMPVRIGAPHDLLGLVDVLGSPAHATGVGLLIRGLTEQTGAPISAPGIGSGIRTRLTGLLGPLLPG